MPNYRVIVTRDLTESTTLTLTADSEEHAHELALEQAKGAHYERDDCSESKPYVGGDIEELDA